MGLMDKITAEQERVKPNRCGVAKAMEVLRKSDREELQAALNNPEYAHSVIAKVLTDEGAKTTSDGVSRHRRGICGCAR
jgi:hypothetical protein